MKIQRSSIYGLSQAPSDFRVVAIISTYNEEDIIVPVIEHLTNEGINTYLIDNWSTDQTFNLINHIDHGIIGIERFPKDGPSATFDWEEILKRKDLLSQELDADWFMHYDADEIRESPWSNVKLKDAIYNVDQLGYNAIEFELLNFYPIDNAYPPGTSLIRYFKYFLYNDFIGNELQIKAWKKTSEGVRLWEMGGHSAEFNGRKVFPCKFIIRHYPIRSQFQGERKIIYERQLRYNPNEKERGWHIQYDDIQKGENFIKKTSNLLKFDSATFYNEFLLKQIIDRDQVEESLRNQLSTKAQELGVTALQVTETGLKLKEVTSLLAESEQRFQEVTSRLTEAEQELQEVTTRLTETENKLQVANTLRTKSEQKIQEITARLTETENKLQVANTLRTKSEQKIQEITARLTETENKLQVANALRTESEQKIANRDLVISEIYGNRAWKYALLLNRFETKFLPHNSQIRKFIISILKPFTLPFRNLFYHRTINRDLILIESSVMFDARWYLENNPDVAGAGIDAARHYLLYGGFEGRDPSPHFSSHWYLTTYPDVFLANINPLVHYLRYGQNEGRTVQNYEMLNTKNP